MDRPAVCDVLYTQSGDCRRHGNRHLTLPQAGQMAQMTIAMAAAYVPLCNGHTVVCLLGTWFAEAPSLH